jgi:protein involved in polysaccharide export with SLBB domain
MKRSFFALLSAAMISAVPIANQAQGQTRPTAAQAQAALTDPAIRARIMAQVRASGMSPDQIRAQLQAQGYSDDVINQLLGGAGADTTALSEDVFAAVRSLGIMDSTAVDSLRKPSMLRKHARVQADSALLDTLGVALQNDTLRAAIKRLLSSPAARRGGVDSGFALFGRDVFARQTTQFDPSINGPLPPDYRIGFGDQFTLVLTGDVERTENLAVTRDGWVVLRDAGQIPAANLTFEQLRSTLAGRLGQVYSGVRTGSTHFSVLPTRVGTNQVFVLGDVRTPNAYQVSRLGTVLTALYAAGGPNDNGDARSIDVKRNSEVIATMDLYDYLLAGSSASDVRLENGDIVFVRPRGPRVRVTGAVVRPATYELKVSESLADAIRMAGGFRPEADRRKVQIERIVPPANRTESGSDKEVIDITSPLLATGYGPTTQKMESGDVVHVFTVAPRVSNRIEVQGNVWSPSPIAFLPGMRLSAALVRAGGVKPDTYLEAVQISRLAPDSTRHMLRVGLKADGTPADNIELAPDDIIRAFSLTEYRTNRYVTVGGAVRAPGRKIQYQQGMTMRDLVMLAGGLDESALLTEAEIARLPESRANGVTATTMRVPLDSTYLFERGLDGKYIGPPGVPVPQGRAPEVFLKPYDAVSILRQPDFDYQRTVTIAGRVKYAGEYSLKTKTERLSDLIDRAGGIAVDGYPAGISFIRQRDTIAGPSVDLPSGLKSRNDRIGIDLPKVLKDPKNIDNILLVDKDSIFIPSYNPIVTVRGAVNSQAAAVAFLQGADINYYIRAAGGGNVKADEGRAYVYQPNGKVETKRRKAFVYTSNPKPEAGSVVVVPEKDPNEKKFDWFAASQASLGLIGSLLAVVALIKTSKP